MFEAVREQFQGELDEIAAPGSASSERVIASAQGAHVTLADGRELLNLCANNYLGLANHPAVLAAARDALGERGYGMASVRFICGTQDIHRELEERISAFLGMRGHDPLLVVLRRQRGPLRDAARRAGRDHLRRAQPRLDHRRRAALQGAPPALCERRHRRARGAPARGIRRAPPPDRHRRRVLDGRPRRAAAAHLRARRAVRRDGHGGRLARGRASWARTGAERRRCTASPSASTSSRARSARRSAARAAASRAGGARRSSVLRQRSRPYLFSNSLAPPIVAASLAVLDLLEGEGAALRERLFAHTARFRRELVGARPRRRARRAPDRAGDVRRRAPRRARPPSAARARRLRRRVLLPRRAAGPGAHPHPALRGALRRGRRPRHRGVRRGRCAT